MPVTDIQAAEALARLVDHLLAHAADHDDLDHLIAALDVVQDLCWNRIQLKDIPEPNHLDPVGLALAASVVERLVGVYSAPPHKQSQTVPSWCVTVPASPAQVWLITPELAEGMEQCPAFARRNIVALANFLSFA